MYDVIGGLLPLALAIAFSPFPVIAIVLLLLSKHPRGNGAAFLAGWLLALLVAIIALTALAKVIEPADTSGPDPVAGVIRLILGALLLVLAVRKVRTGAPTDASGKAVLPGWMTSLTTTVPRRAFTTGLIVAGANPKNLAFAAAAALTIGTGGLDAAQIVTAIVIFAIVASITILVPVVGYALVAERLMGPLERLELWLLANHTGIMAILLVVFGVVVIGNGIASF